MPLFLYTTGAFLRAVSKGDTVEVAQYLKQDLNWANARNKQGESALHLAAEKGHLNIIRELVASGADLEAQNRYGGTPLSEAVANAKETAITLLLELGANPDGAGSSQLPLGIAVSRNMPRVVRLLLAGKANPNLNSPLLVAAQYNHGETALALVEAGARLDAHDPYYRYPLHFAASTGGFDLARAILDKAAGQDKTVDINVRESNNGYTPLHFAVMYGWSKIVELLLERDARTDINRIPDKNAETWTLAGPHQVALVGVYPALGRRLTHIFNFEARERLTISENLKTGAENMAPPEKFDTLEEQYLARALEAFRKLGGLAEDAHVFSGRTGKKTLSAPGA